MRGVTRRSIRVDARDWTFAEAGRVSVWTKAESVTLFDDLGAGL